MMPKTLIERYVKKLEEDHSVVFLHNEMVYVIQWSDSNEGWYIEIFDPYLLGMDLDSKDGGLCTGSAQDAVEFLL